MKNGKTHVLPEVSEQVQNLKRLMAADDWNTAITLGEGLPETFKTAFDLFMIDLLSTKMKLMLNYPTTVGI